MARQSGFYVPSTTSASYVASKRDELGTLKYEGALSQVGIQEQAALQQLRSQYDQTINNAYAAYLNQNRGIRGSMMGQGYKNAYLEASRQNMMANIAEASMNASQVRQELSQSVGEQVGAIQAAQQQETNYFNRAESFARNYYNYLKGLTMQDKSGNVINYLDEFERSLNTPEYAYDKIFATNAIGSDTMAGYYDAEGNAAMSFDDWIYSQMGGSSEDQGWYQWYIEQGGKGEYENIAQKGLEERKANYMGTGRSYEDVKTEYETQKKYERENSLDSETSKRTALKLKSDIADNLSTVTVNIFGNNDFEDSDTTVTIDGIQYDFDTGLIKDEKQKTLFEKADVGQLFLIDGEGYIKLKDGRIGRLAKVTQNNKDFMDKLTSYLSDSIYEIKDIPGLSQKNARQEKKDSMTNFTNFLSGMGKAIAGHS